MKTQRVTAVFFGILALTVGGVAHEAVAAAYAARVLRRRR